MYYKDKLVIPDQYVLRAILIEEAHATPTGGHGGYLKTLKSLSSNVYWKGMNKDVKQYIQNCLICQQRKYQTLSSGVLLQPLPIPERIWEDISIDFITGRFAQV